MLLIKYSQMLRRNGGHSPGLDHLDESSVCMFRGLFSDVMIETQGGH